jgi:hypothetical protein
MDRDSSKNKYQPNSYYRMKNMRITSFEELSNGVVQSIEGNILSISFDNIYKDFFVIGHCVIRNYLIVWTTDNTTTGGTGIIWRTDLSVSIPSWTKIYESADMNLTTAYPIYDEAIGYYEDSDLIKVYWTDNYNMIRHINVAEVYDNTYDVSQLDILSEVTINAPIITNISGGNLLVGKIQYAYQYYNINGLETVYSPCTGLVHLTQASEL